MMKYVISFVIATGVLFAYIVMLLIQPIVGTTVSTANTSMAGAVAGANVTFASTFAVVNSFPLWMWVIPGVVGAIGIVIVLKSGISY